MKTALFVDFDNVYSGLRRISAQGAERFARHPARWLRWLTEDLPQAVAAIEGVGGRRVLVRRCYLNPVMFQQYRRPFHEAGFEIVDCPPMTATGKTSTDIHLVLDTMDALLDATHFDEFVVFSADADFSPVLRRLRRHDRRTIVFAAGAMSEAYKASADLVIDIPTFIREGLQLVEAEPEEEAETVVEAGRVQVAMGDLRQQATIAVRRAVLEAVGPMPLPTLATVLQRELPGLRECQWAGAGSFGLLMRQLAPAGVVFDFQGELAYDQSRRDRSRAQQPIAEVRSPAQPVPGVGSGAPATTSPPPEPLSTEEIDLAAMRVIRQRVALSQRPVLFSSLGTDLRQELPQLAGGWNGAPTLAALLQRLNLEPLLRAELEDGSTFVLYDPERHTAPAGVVNDAVVAAMLRAAELPAIRAQDLARVLHHARSHMGRSEPFEISAVSRSVAEALAADGRPVSPRRVAAVLQALIFGGLDTSQGFADAEQLSAAAMGVILSAWSRETQVQADDEARRRLMAWLQAPAL